MRQIFNFNCISPLSLHSPSHLWSRLSCSPIPRSFFGPGEKKELVGRGQKLVDELPSLSAHQELDNNWGRVGGGAFGFEA